MTEQELHKIIERLLKLPKECEWAEFKMNLKTEDEIGKYISALSNGACLQNEPFGYLAFGINDVTLQPEGTSFKATLHKVGNEELEHWLLQRLSPRIEIAIFETTFQNKAITLFQVLAAHGQPTCFSNHDYVRVGSITRSLKDFPEKEKKIWTKGPKQIFEKSISLQVDTAADVVSLLDTQCYFDLLKTPYPSNRDAVIERFVSEKFIKANTHGYVITNLGAILFAKNMQDFDTVKRKTVRVIQYDGKNKIKTLKDQESKLGYAVGFESILKYINDLLPSNEVIGQALRETKLMYPVIAIRELVANAIIHQDFEIHGTGPMIEIYADRIEITNPGLPLIEPLRFIDEYQSRNEDLAAMMRRFGICEEKGSGMDKVVLNIELYQLPAYKIQVKEKHTVAILFAHKTLNDMDKNERIQACYQHCCLRHVMNEKMSNKSLRERLKIDEKNYSNASRIIRETLVEGLIKEVDPENKSRKYASYLPFWA